MNERLRLIDAILTLADAELAKEEQRVGVMRALLSESVELLRDMRRTESLLVRLRQARAGNSERSDPAANADSDEEIARLEQEVLA